jgi:glutamine cyclotransferase
MKKKILVAILITVGIGLISFFLYKNNVTPLEDEALLCHFTIQDNITLTHRQKLDIPIASIEQINSVELRIGDSLLAKWTKPSKLVHYELNSKDLPVGLVSLVLIAKTKEGKEIRDERIFQIVSDIVPQSWGIKIVNEYPHLDSSYTQGLAFHNNKLFESTGDPNTTGSSLVGEIALETGKINRRTGLDNTFFGEGITILGDKIFQITWKNQTCFVYNAPDFAKLKTFTYTGEGWGICNDGKYLIMSDGTDRLSYRDPETFELLKTVDVYTNEGPITKLNELEWINGLIYANIYTTNLVAVIDPAYGKVMAIIDATELVRRGKGTGNGEVLNGIAYNSSNRKIYMTGKFWPKLFEIEVLKTPFKGL